MQFADLHLIPALARAVAAEGYEEPTPIQLKAIPHVLEGRDLLACAQTGTGKTAAFALPILQRLSKAPGGRGPRALVLSPTRELAAQIGESFMTYGKNLSMKTLVLFGGVSMNRQIAALRENWDIIVATPGRLLDLLGQRRLSFGSLEVLVLDEADRMLDMGFLPDVRRILAGLPSKRQTLLFSATMPPDIAALASNMMREPVTVAVNPVASTAEKIVQSIFFVSKSDKRSLLEDLLRRERSLRALVFTRTKHGADRVVEHLQRARIPAVAIHGNKSQGARERALGAFRSGSAPILVATDIAARGIDVDGVTHVINYDLPNIPESYVHRIGRTARAGAEGIALSFCDTEEVPFLVDIERLVKVEIPVNREHDFHDGRIEAAYGDALSRRQRSVAQRRPQVTGRGHRPERGRQASPRTSNSRSR